MDIYKSYAFESQKSYRGEISYYKLFLKIDSQSDYQSIAKCKCCENPASFWTTKRDSRSLSVAIIMMMMLIRNFCSIFLLAWPRWEWDCGREKSKLHQQLTACGGGARLRRSGEKTEKDIMERRRKQCGVARGRESLGSSVARRVIFAGKT